MSITVEHDKRKREILEKSLDIFMEEGFEDTTFQKIAERCGITRTILYLYFKNKREIFNFSIKLFTDRIESSLKEIAANRSLSHGDRIAAVIERTIADCIENRRLLLVIHDYLGHVRTTGGNPDERVKRRTIRMKHLLAGILIDGQRSGEFGRFSIKAASELLYALIEAEIFRLTVLAREDAGSIPQGARLIADSFRAMALFSHGFPAPTASPAPAPAAAVVDEASASKASDGSTRLARGR
ncbi:MAG TPA: TetR/AcrR family transcriptional regulator [Rectinemataceae bacterium]|nr:TetR/AcrR family transcriptional regulator [Rectinemataceae bacterium]